MDYDKQLAAVEAFVLAEDRFAALHSEFAPNSDSALFLTGMSFMECSKLTDYHALSCSDTSEAVHALKLPQATFVGFHCKRNHSLMLHNQAGNNIRSCTTTLHSIV